MSIFSFSSSFRSKFSVGSIFGLFFKKNITFLKFGGLRIGSLKLLRFFSFIGFYFYLRFGCPVINIIIFN